MFLSRMYIAVSDKALDWSLTEHTPWWTPYRCAIGSLVTFWAANSPTSGVDSGVGPDARFA